MRRFMTMVATAALALGLMAAPAMADRPSDAGTSIVGAAVADAELSTLVGFLTNAGLVDALSGKNHKTVFAPTNAAFDAVLGSLNEDQVDVVVENLESILLYHVTRGDRLSPSVIGARQIKMLNGEFFMPGGDAILPAIAAADITATDGVIHKINTVLIPPSVAGLIADAA